MSDQVRVHTTSELHEADACVGALAQQGILAEVENTFASSSDALGLSQPVDYYVIVATVDAERASEILTRALSVNDADTAEIEVDLNQLKGPISVRCERCGETTKFPGTMDGTTQECPTCFAFLDVGTLAEWNDWNVIEVEGEPDETEPEQSPG